MPRATLTDERAGVSLHWIDLQANLNLFPVERKVFFGLLRSTRTEARLLSEFSICYSVGQVKKVARFQKGMPTDGASIPRPLWAAVGAPFDGDYTFGAVAHDGFYRSQIEPRAVADCLFGLAIEWAGGNGKAKRFAVETFAGLTYRSYRKSAKAFAAEFVRVEILANGQGNASHESEIEQRRGLR